MPLASTLSGGDLAGYGGVVDLTSQKPTPGFEMIKKNVIELGCGNRWPRLGEYICPPTYLHGGVSAEICATLARCGERSP